MAEGERKRKSTIKFKEDDYGLFERNGKLYKFKDFNSKKHTATFEEIEEPEKFKTEFDEIVRKLIPHIDKKKLLIDVLRNYPKKEMDDIHDRIFKKRQPIKSAPLCYSIMIGKKHIVIRG